MVYFLVGCAVVFLVMVLCKTVSNAVGKARDAAKEARDRKAGAYRESKPQDLSDRYK